MANVLGQIHGSLVFSRRTRVLANEVASVLPNGDVLDVGCGDGTIDTLIQECRPRVKITGVDVLVRPSARIKVTKFDGVHLPFGDKSYDAVIFIDVLHHTDDPAALLAEAKRVARGAIVIKDHTMDGPFAYQRLRFMDWVGNAPHGVVLPYNYWTEQGWRNAFMGLGLAIVQWRSEIPLYPFPASFVFGRGLHFVAKLAPC